MKDADRFKLHFGPYKTPRFKYRDIVWDEVRGWVRLAETPATISRPDLVVYRGLLKTVKRESNQAAKNQ